MHADDEKLERIEESGEEGNMPEDRNEDDLVTVAF